MTGASRDRSGRRRLVEETEAHVVVRLLLLLLLLLLSGGVLGRGSAAGSGSTASDGGTATTDVGEELLDVLALEGLGEERGPDGLDLNTSGLGEGGDLVTGDLNTLVGDCGLVRSSGGSRSCCCA
jgi:hypothetical protein